MPPRTAAARTPTAPPGTAALLPEWVHRLACAVWVSGPDRRLVYLNAAAERMLGLEGRTVLGRACHQVVASRSPDGSSLCGRDCRPARDALGREPIAPVDADLGRPDRPTRRARWTVLPIDVPGYAEPWLLHMADSTDRRHARDAYLQRVADRSAPLREIEGPAARDPLTEREGEILDLLCEDLEPSRIAHRLGIRRVTVRNHVQRLLAKLGAHSIPEAVALRLTR